MLSFLHITLSIVCLAVGTAIFLMQKGTNCHRLAGKIYSVSMIGLNAAALGIYKLTGHFNLFHLTAILSLVLVLIGWAQAALRKPLRRWLHRHYIYMCWSYVGLVAAAFSEGIVRVPALKAVVSRRGNWVIIATQVVLIGLSAWLINGKRKSILARYGADGLRDGLPVNPS